MCADRTVLTALLAGQLSSEDHARVEAHVSNCAVCQERLRELDESPAEAGTAEFLNVLRSVATEYRAEDAPRFDHVVQQLKAGRIEPLQTAQGESELINETIGDYRIVREVDHGGMGIVYEAEQLSLRRRVALKTLPFASLLDARRLARFQNEARMAAHLEHPHVVPVYAVGVERGIHYYAMRFINGPNLAQILREVRQRAAPVPTASPQAAVPTHSLGTTVNDAGNVSQQSSALLQSLRATPDLDGSYLRAVTGLILTAAEAVEYAHSQGVVHRDIKPSNLMLDAAGHLWVADFGLARIAGDGSASTSGALLGTVPYMSPEQASAGNGVADQRSDVYSLGATLYELTTLVPPFGDAPIPTLLRRIANEDPPPPRRHNSRIPRDLETTILKSLAKEPAERYQTAQALADDLRRFLEAKPIRASRPRVADRVARIVRKHPSAIAATGLVLFLLAGLSGLLAVAVGDRDRSNAELTSAKTSLEKLNADLVSANDRAATALASARQSELTARQQVYAQDVHQASQSLEQLDLSQATSFLGRHIPQSGVDDLRGFEWYLLNRRCRGVGKTTKVSQSPLYAVCYSPDGRWMAAGGDDAVLHVWQTETGREHLQIATGQKDINAISFSRDGRTLYTTGDDGTIRRWRLSDSEGQIVVQRQSEKAMDLRLTPDESTLITTWGSDSMIRLWNAQTGMPTGELPGHDRTVTSIDLAIDGKSLVSSSSDGTARLWDLDSLTCTRTLDAGDGRLVSAAFSTDGKYVVTGGVGMTVRVWRCVDGTSTMLGSHLDRIHVARFLLSGAAVLAGDASGSVRIWKIPVAFQSGDNALTITGTASSESGADAFKPTAWHAHADRVHGLAVSPDGKDIATASSDGTLRITDLAATTNEGSWPQLVECVNFRFGWRHELLTWQAQPSSDMPPCPEVTLHDLKHRTSQTIASPVSQKVCTAAISPDGQTVVFGHPHGLLTIVPRAAGKAPTVIDLSSPEVVDCLEFLSDGRTLIVQLGFDADSIRFLETESWTRLDGYPQLAATGQFHVSVSGQRLVTRNSVQAFLCDFSQMPATLREFIHSEGVGDAELSPDETVLATGCDDRTIKLWDVASGKICGELIGHGKKVLNVRFSPDGSTLVSHGQDEATKLWHVPSRRFLFDLTAKAHLVGFSPSGKYLAYALADGGIVVHDLEALYRDGEQLVAE